MNNSFLVVDTLSFFSLIAIFIKFRSTRTVFYLHKNNSIFTRLTIKTLSKWGWCFEQICYTLSPAGGVSPYKELQKKLIETIKVCQQSLFSKQVDVLLQTSEYERKRLLACFGRYAGAELYFPVQLYIILSVKFQHPDKVKTVLLRKNIFSDIVRGIYRDAGFKPYFYPSFGRRNIFPRDDYDMDKFLFREYSFHRRNLIRASLLVCYSFLCKSAYFFLKLRKPVKKHKICALVFNRYATELCNCLPWGKEEQDYLKDETLLLYLSYMPKSARNFYDCRSDRHLEYSFNPFTGNKDIELIKTWAYFINFLFRNIIKYRKLFGWQGIKLWMSNYLLNILTYLSFFESLFWVNGTKVLWTMNADDSITQMAAMAINRAGGVSLGTSWSMCPLPQWNVQHNQNDIYFIWGKRSKDISLSNNDQCKFLVINGYPVGQIFAYEFQKAQDLRVLIIRQYKAKNILVFIDNIVANDYIISPEDNLEFYREIFSWLEENTANFLIIKAKRSETISKSPVIKEKIDNFCRKKRILILYDRSVFYPGLAADAIISTSLTLLSVTALFGRPCIYYDTHNFTHDFPLKLSNIRIVHNAAEMRPTINNLIEESHRLGYPEKLQPIADSVIDPFADGEATDRIREYIKNSLVKFDKGHTNIEAMDYANTQHIKRWGKDTVIPGPL